MDDVVLFKIIVGTIIFACMIYSSSKKNKATTIGLLIMLIAYLILVFYTI